MEYRYIWATYRNWSFKNLEGIQDLEGWKTSLIITSEDCVYNFSNFKKKGIPILRVNPKKDLKKGGKAYNTLKEINPQVIFFNGWSWLVPNDILEKYLNVVLHPGKLPKDKGGSPIQNQMRKGESWTYANLIKLEKDIDSGPIYFKEKISLEGEVEDVWDRMTSAGIVTAKNLLEAISQNKLIPIPQNGESSIYKRVYPNESEITKDISSEYAQRIVRAHSESDPNSYVVPAFIKTIDGRLNLKKSLLYIPENVKEVDWNFNLSGKSLDKLILEVNNGISVISFPDKQGKKIYITRVSKGE